MQTALVGRELATEIYKVLGTLAQIADTYDDRPGGAGAPAPDSLAVKISIGSCRKARELLKRLPSKS